MSDQIRWTMSLRKRDEDLIEYFSSVGDGDRSAECRKLMYLGLKMLELQANGMEPTADPTPDEIIRPLRRSKNETPEEAEQNELNLYNERLDALI